MPNFKEQRGLCYPVEDWERVNEAVQRTMATGVAYELDVQALRNGSIIWITTRGEVVQDADSQILGLRGTVQDITERKQAEEARRESEQRWAVTLASVGDAVITTGTDGRVTFLNKTAEELTGWSMAEVAGKPLKEMFHIINEHTRAAVEDPVSKVLQSGMIVGLANHTVLLRRGGGEIPIDDSGAPIRNDEGRILGVVLVFRDISERRRVEETIRQSHKQNEFLANVIQQSSQPFAVGYPDGRLGLFNKAFAQLTCYSTEELRRIDWAKVLTPKEWLASERASLEELHRTGQPVRYQKEYIRKDGSRVPIELLVHLARDAEGNPQYYYSFLTDITERKRAEESLRLPMRGWSGWHASPRRTRTPLRGCRLRDGSFTGIRRLRHFPGGPARRARRSRNHSCRWSNRPCRKDGRQSRI